jgi:hypothetical protein
VSQICVKDKAISFLKYLTHNREFFYPKQNIPKEKLSQQESKENSAKHAIYFL